jgi:Undecaprenyl-phosphate glucose phosphotransferase
MLRLRLNLVKLVLQLVIFALPAVAFLLAGYVRFGAGLFFHIQGAFDLRAYLVLLIFASLSWAFISSQAGLAKPQRFFAAGGKTRKIAGACATTYVVTLVATFFYREAQFSRTFAVLSCVFLFLLTVGSQVLFRFVLEGLRRKGKHCLHVLIIGSDQFAVDTGERLLRGPILPSDVAGYVALPGQSVAPEARPVYQLGDLPRLAIGNGLDEAILAIPHPLFAEIPSLLKQLDPLCVPVRAVLDWGEGVKISDQLFDLGGIPMLDLKPTAAESVSYFVMKRAFDLVFSSLVLVVTLPLMLLIAMAIKLTSFGPVFFVQERVGLKGQIFRMYKFRTMRLSSGEEAGTRWTVKDDPRCTRIGAVLRHTSLDELPQFFNVIKGDMSVVGPRPERPHFVHKFASQLDKYNSRHYVKTGITGWAQVNGFRGDTSITERVQYDLYYMRNWSIGFDLQIILLTLFRGIVSKNAY